MINEYPLMYGTEEIPVQIIRSKRKTLAIQVTSDCRVKARVPLGVSDRDIREFISKHRGWILQKVMEASFRKDKYGKQQCLRLIINLIICAL